MGFIKDKSKLAAKQKKEALDRFLSPDTFFMREGPDPVNYILLDTDSVCVWEHNAYIQGQWTQFTCPDESNSECCRVLGRRYVKNHRGYGRGVRYYLSIVTATPFVDKQQNERNYELKLLPLRKNSNSALEIALDHARKSSRPLNNALVTVYRPEKKDPGEGSNPQIGEAVDVERLWSLTSYKRVPLSKMWADAERDPAKMEELLMLFDVEPDSEGILPKIVPPFNYQHVLCPQSEEDMKELLATVTPVSDLGRISPTGGSSAGGGLLKTHDDVPF